MSIETLTLSSIPLVLGQVNPIVINLLVGAFLLVSIVMILIVLIQRPQGGGLGGAFGSGGGGGGGGAGQTAFGTKTGDVLTGGTIGIFVLFLVFAIILNFVTRPPVAEPALPTIAAPATTEPIPAEDSTSVDPENQLDEATEQSVEPTEEEIDTDLNQTGNDVDYGASDPKVTDD